MTTTAMRRLIARQTFRYIQAAHVPDVQVGVVPGPTAFGGARAAPVKWKRAPAGRVPCRGQAGRNAQPPPPRMAPVVGAAACGPANGGSTRG